MKEEQGLVLTVDGETARIKVGRHEDCSGCGACPSSQNVILEATNKLGAKAGQRVRFVFAEQNAVLGAFVVFVLPLIAAGVGGLLAFNCNLFGGGDSGMIWGAVIFFLLSLVAVKIFDRRLSKQQNLKPIITQIL